MQEFEFILTGPDAQAAAAELTHTLADFGADLTTRPLPTSEEAIQRGLDPIALAGLILSIPSAVLAVMDLKDRIAKRRRAEALIEAAGRIRIERRVEVMAVTLEGNRPLADLDADQVLALVERLDSDD